MHDEGLPAARLTCAAYIDGKNVTIALFETIVLLLHPRVDVPYSLVVNELEFGW